MKTQGLTFKKFDLHIHTPRSECFGDKFDDDISAAKAIVNEAVRKELGAIAITDHNTGEFMDIVKKIALNTGLTVFPGVEITVGDAHNHIIAILDVNKTSEDIEDLLMAVDIPHDKRGKKNAFSKYSVVEVIDIICNDHFKGLAIPAHIDSTNGVFTQMNGEPRIKLIQHQKLISVEALNHPKVSLLLNGRDPQYKRKLAVYQSSDNPSIDEHGKPIISGPCSGMHSIAGIGYRHTYFKVDEEINLESLRQCFIDPEVRIRQSWEYKKNIYPHIKSLKINSGYLNELEASFHPGLNSILGAKGVGKSLLIEFIRFSLDQEPSQAEIYEDHFRKLDKQLRQYGEVEIVVCDESGKEFKIKRTFDPTCDNPIQCTDLSTGGIIEVNIYKLFPIICLSQNEIIKITEDKKNEQLQFIDKFFDFHFYRNQIDALEEDLEDLDTEFSSAIKDSHERKKLEKQLETANTELQRFTEQLKNPIFSEISKYEQKDKLFRTHEQYLTNLAKSISEFSKQISREKIPPLENEFKNDPALRRNLDTLDKATSSLLDGLKLLQAELQKSLEAVKAEYEKWKVDFNLKKTQFQDVVLKLGGDIQTLEQNRKAKVREIENFEKRLSKIKDKTNQFKQVNELRNQKLQELKEVYSSYFQKRKTKCEFFEEASKGNLKIEIIESSNRDEFKKSLLSLKRRSYLRDSEIEQIGEKIAPDDFILHLLRYDVLKETKPDKAAENILAISSKVELPIDKVKTLATHLLDSVVNGDITYEHLLRLQYKAYPEDRPVIKYNIGDLTNPHFESLDKISTGQKCTAMIILALSDEKMPVIIDQPEDSLDIRSIWDDMCTKLRTGKEKRQFIFTTHNSSVAVASDTDKFMIMEGTASRGEIVLVGTVDNEKIRKEIIDYLEGGINTYKLKYLKYNMPKDINE